jgi:DNA-binding beta-propeller fold protein YncE
MLIPLATATGCATNRVTVDPVYFPPPPGEARVVHLKSFNSLRDLVPSHVRWVDVFRGRPVSPYVTTPAGIAYQEGHLYICDTGLNAVHDWDLTTGRARRIGLSGDVMLAKPVAVAVSGANVAPHLVGGEASRPTVFVADTGRGEIIAFDADGSAVGPLRPPGGEAYKPVALVAHASNLYVADIVSHRIDVFSISSGEHIGSIGEIGSEPGQFYFPMGLTANSGGHLFVSDMMNARVQVFDAQSRFKLSMGQPGDRYGDMGRPKHVAVGPDGTIFIADSEFAHVHLFNSEGQLLLLVGGPEDKPGGTPMPVGVAVASMLPERLSLLVPADFEAAYYLFTTNAIGSKRISLFAVGSGR